jgi:hypothetical protein
VGDVGVDGSSEVNGDNVEGWERSSARTTTAGMPLVMDVAIKASGLVAIQMPSRSAGMVWWWS